MAGRSFAGLLADQQPAQAGVVTPEQLNLGALEQQHGLPPGLLSAVMQQESGGKVNAVSPAGAQGAFQFMPETAAQYGIDPRNPQQAAAAAARMYAELGQKYKGDLPKMLAGYNWGQGNVDRQGMQNMPEETRNYIQSIMGKLQTSVVEPVQEAPARQALQQATGRSFAGLLADAEAPVQQPPADESFMERTRRLGAAIDAGQPLEPGGEQPSKLGGWGTYAQRFGRGVMDPVTGIQQLANLAIPDVAERAMMGAVGGGDKTFNQMIAEREAGLQQALKDQGMSGFDFARMAGNIASPVNLALGAAKLPAAAASKLPQAAQWAARMAVPAAAQAAVQPTFDTKTTKQETSDFLADKAKQVAAGAGFGMLGGAVAQGLTSAGGKVAGMVTGAVDERAKEVMDLAKQWKIPLTAADVDEPRRSFLRRTQQLVERIPVGLDAQAQRAAAVTSAKDYAEQGLEAMRKLPYTNLVDVQKAAASGGKRAKEAQFVLNLVDEAGEDWRKVVRASGNLKGLRMKLSSDKLYGDLGQAMGAKKQVDPRQLTDTLNRLIVTEGKRIRGDRTLASKLSRFQDQLDNPEFVPTWDNLRDLRTTLNEEVMSMTKPGVKEPPGHADAYRAMIDAISGDLDTFASRHPNGNVRTLWKQADAFYKKNVAPFKDRDLATVLRDVDTDHVYARFVANDDPSHQTKMWKALDEKGRSAVRYGMISEEVEKAFNPSMGTIDAVKLSNSLHRLHNASATYFKGPAKAELDGFTKIMGHLKHMSEPEGGQFGYGVGYGAAFGTALGLTGWPGAAAGIGTAAGLKQLLTTERGLKILFAANLAKQGSPQMTKLTDEAIKLATEASAEAAGAQAGRQAPTILDRAGGVGAAIGGQAAGRAVGGNPPKEEKRR